MITTNPQISNDSRPISEIEERTPNKICISPIVKGIIAGLISSIAIGIFFGFLPAVGGFILGFAVVICCARLCKKVSKDVPKNDSTTKSTKSWDKFTAEYDLRHKRRDLAMRNAREARRFMHQDQPYTDYTYRSAQRQAGALNESDLFIAEFDSRKERRNKALRDAREARDL